MKLTKTEIDKIEINKSNLIFEYLTINYNSCLSQIDLNSFLCKKSNRRMKILFKKFFDNMDRLTFQNAMQFNFDVLSFAIQIFYLILKTRIQI